MYSRSERLLDRGFIAERLIMHKKLVGPICTWLLELGCVGN